VLAFCNGHLKRVSGVSTREDQQVPRRDRAPVAWAEREAGIEDVSETYGGGVERMS
jgi:hypothetical protein